jgi:hypothetical protein
MNQKNIFTVLSAVLILQGICFYFLGDQLMTSAFPDVADPGHHALVQLFQVPAALSIVVGLIAYATRTTPNVAWAFAIGFGVLLCITLKHLLVDNIHVPIPAVIIQILIVLACAFAWSRKA